MRKCAQTNWDSSYIEPWQSYATMASSKDIIDTTEEYHFQTKKMLNSIEKDLEETNELGVSTASALAKQDQTLEHVHHGMQDVKRGVKRTHKLLDTFAKWSSLGFGKSKSRKAGRRIGKDFEADARFDRLKKSKNGQSIIKEKGYSAKAGAEKQPQQKAVQPFCGNSSGSSSKNCEWSSTCLENSMIRLDLDGAPMSQVKAILESSNESSYSRAELRQLDRIHEMVSNLGEISKEISETLEQQTDAISTINETTTKQLKKTTKARARSAWHLNKNRK